MKNKKAWPHIGTGHIMKGESTMEENLTQTQEQEPSPAPAPAPAPAPSPKRNRLPIIIVAAVVAIVAVGAIAFGVARQQAAAKAAEYKAQMREAGSEMLNGAGTFMDMMDQTMSVWYNSIHKKDDPETDPYTKNVAGRFNSDFNDSLSALWSSDSFQQQRSDAKANKETVDSLMQSIKDSPDSLEREYDAVMALYEPYGKLYEAAVNPSGNYNNYSSGALEASQDFLSKNDALKAVLPAE